MINTKLYVDILSDQAKEDGRPYEMALSNFCDYLLDLFSVQKAQERYQAEVDKIDVNLFTGSANVFKLEGLWGVVYVGLALVIQCFPEGSFWQITENITGKKKAEILAAEAAKIAEEKKRDEKYEAALQKARQEADPWHEALRYGRRRPRKPTSRLHK